MNPYDAVWNDFLTMLIFVSVIPIVYLATTILQAFHEYMVTLVAKDGTDIHVPYDAFRAYTFLGCTAGALSTAAGASLSWALGCGIAIVGCVAFIRSRLL